MTTPADARPPKRARMPFPLPAKILACFFLNLLLLAVVAAFVAQGQFRFGLDSLLAGRSGERLQTMSELVVSDLNKSRRAEWPDILKRFADAYHVQLAAVLNDGTRLAGTIMDPPASVLAKLAEGLADRRRPLPPEMRGPRERPEEEFRPGPPNPQPRNLLRENPPGD